jgi:hypothetical protein
MAGHGIAVSPSQAQLVNSQHGGLAAFGRDDSHREQTELLQPPLKSALAERR